MRIFKILHTIIVKIYFGCFLGLFGYLQLKMSGCEKIQISWKNACFILFEPLVMYFMWGTLLG